MFLKNLVAAGKESLHPLLIEGTLAEHSQVVNLLGEHGRVFLALGVFQFDLGN